MMGARYGVLILEGNWGEDYATYLTDSRSTSRLYTALEDLLSLKQPLKFIQRPLLNSRFVQDIQNFITLTENQEGGTVIILSAHGERIETDDGRTRKRVLNALDGSLNLSLQIKGVRDLGRTILILDSCEVGEGLKSFQKIAKALAVVGFGKSVNWIDSTLFVLALLDKLNQNGYFSNKAEIDKVAKKAIEKMWKNPYLELTKTLEAEKEFYIPNSS